MGDVVNLRRARKAKARAQEEKDAETRRAQFGTPKELSDLAKARADKAIRDIEGHKKD